MEIFKLFGSIFVDSDAADKSIKKTGENAEGFATRLGNGIKTAAKWGAAVAAAAGTIAVAIGTKAVAAASELETSFAKVNTLLDDTTDLESYKKAIIDLSNKTGVETAALCESIYSAISASVDQASAIDFVASALKLAEGGFTDAATAVDVMTTAINAYGLSAEDATQVSDYLITTQNLGKTSVGELASSLGKVIPIAAAYGVKMDDLCANTALLTKNGIATAEAITYTKAMLNELGDSGSTVGGILREKTGQSFAELEAGGMSLGDIIAILGESVDGDTSAFNELWSSSEAGVGALTLLKTGAEEYNSTLEEMRESAGATEMAYEKMHNTFSTKVEQLKTITTNTLAEIGNTLLPFANDVLDWVISNMPLIQNIVQTVIGALQLAVEGFCNIVQGVFSAIRTSLDDTGITFEDVMSAVQNIFSAAWDFLVFIWDSVGQPLLNFMMEAFGWLLGNWEAVTGAIEEAFGLLWSVFEDIWNALGQPLFEGIAGRMAWLSENWDTIAGMIQAAFQILWDMCSTLWNSVGQPIFELIGFVIGELAGLFDRHLDDILTLFQEAMEGIRDIWENRLRPVFEAIGSFLKEVLLPTFEYVFKNVIEPLVEDVFNAINWLWENVLNPVLDIICDFLLGAFTGDWNSAMEGILGIVTGLFDGIRNIWENFLKPVFEAIGSFLKEVLLPAFEFVFRTVIEPLVRNVFDAIGRLWNNTLKPVFDGICDFLLGVFTGNWDQALTGILNIVTGIFNGIRNAVEKPMDMIRDIVENAINFILDKFDFDWELPHLKLPHFSIQGEFSLNPPSVPSLGIDWYAKGAVLEEPTVFGMNPENGNAMVGGEAGPEAVAPIETLQQYVREAVAGQNAELIAVLRQILQAILVMDAGLLEKMAEALESMRFEIKWREFARLVRGAAK